MIALEGEELPKPLTLTHETERWKTTTLNDYEARKLLRPIFRNGKLVYECPPLSESVKYRENEMERFWDEYKRLVNPHVYKVDLSDELYALKQNLLNKR